MGKKTELVAKAADKTTQLQYDAAANRQRRRVNITNLKSEDNVLKARDRDKVVSEARILRRNASVVAWSIRTHLDYISTFHFQSRSGNDAVDIAVEKLIETWSLAENCDVAGRHSLQRLVRLAEGCATTDGDVFFYKLSSGAIQLIEADKVRTPSNFGDYEGKLDPKDFTHGVKTTAGGKALAYAICDRSGSNGFQLKTVAPAKYIIQHGYFDRYDQIRGISPLASAINTFCDLYESQDYALARMKLSQLFALKFKRSGDTGELEGDAGNAGYGFDFGKGPQAIDLDPGDDAEFLESAQPSTQFQSFLQTGIQLGLKALDIPYSFYAENYTNYSGARQALLQYQQSANIKRQALRRILLDLTKWRLQIFVDDNELKLPKGWTVDDIAIDYVGQGFSWIDPLKEAKADVLLVESGLKSRQEISKARGKDWYDIADQIKAEQAYLQELGIAPSEPAITGG